MEKPIMNQGLPLPECSSGECRSIGILCLGGSSNVQTFRRSVRSQLALIQLENQRAIMQQNMKRLSSRWKWSRSSAANASYMRKPQWKEWTLPRPMPLLFRGFCCADRFDMTMIGPGIATHCCGHSLGGGYEITHSCWTREGAYLCRP